MLSMNECFQVKNSFWKNLTVLHMRFRFAQGLVGVFFQMQVMKILTLFQTKKLCLSFQQSFSLTHSHTHSHTHTLLLLAFFLSLFIFLITVERWKRGKKWKSMFERNTLKTIIFFILVIWTYFKPMFLCASMYYQERSTFSDGKYLSFWFHFSNCWLKSGSTD